MPHLYLLKRGLASLHSAEESTLVFNAPDLSGTSAIIDDKTLSLPQIGDTHRCARNEIALETSDGVTFHHPNFQLSDETFIHDRQAFNHGQPTLPTPVLQSPLPIGTTKQIIDLDIHVTQGSLGIDTDTCNIASADSSTLLHMTFGRTME